MTNQRSQELQEMDRDLGVQAEVARQIAGEIHLVRERAMNALHAAIKELEASQDSCEGLADNLREQAEEQGRSSLRLAALEADNQRLREALREWMDVAAYAEPEALKAGIKRAYNMGRRALAAGGA